LSLVRAEDPVVAIPEAPEESAESESSATLEWLTGEHFLFAPAAPEAASTGTDVFEAMAPDEATPTPSARAEDVIAARLDALAAKVRSGEIGVVGVDGDAPDAVLLASMLTALLKSRF
jgi:hypothetical protein